MEILLIIYLILGYWATGKTVYANKIIITDGKSLFISRIVMAFILGWILIPIALIKTIFGR